MAAAQPENMRRGAHQKGGRNKTGPVKLADHCHASGHSRLATGRFQVELRPFLILSQGSIGSPFGSGIGPTGMHGCRQGQLRRASTYAGVGLGPVQGGDAGLLVATVLHGRLAGPAAECAIESADF